MRRLVPVICLPVEYEAKCHPSFSYSFILWLPLPRITSSLVISDPATHTCPAVTSAFSHLYLSVCDTPVHLHSPTALIDDFAMQ